MQGAARGPRLPADYQILKRRHGEQQRAVLETGIKQIARFTGVAQWEQKSTAAMERQRIRAAAQKRREEYAEQLNERRQKLADLLHQEHVMYEEEFRNSFESPEERRQRMKERAEKVKREREQARRELAAKCLKQRDRLAQDEMRLQQSQMRTLKIAKERVKQVEDIEERKRHEQEMDAEFAREWLDGIEAKRQREERERAEAAMRNQQMREVLDSQVSDLERRKDLQRQELEAQRQMWRAQWQQEAEEEREAAIRREREQVLSRTEIQGENLERAHRRTEEAKLEKQLDQYLLRQQLEKDRQAEEARRAKSTALAAAQREFQDHLRQMAVREAQDETELERIRREESEKEWIKREERWKREADAREALMVEVDRTRQEQLEARRAAAEQQRIDDQMYIQRKRSEDELENERLARLAREEAERRIVHRQLLEEQVREKQRMRDIDRQRELLIDKRAARYTEEFDGKIEEMRNEILENDDILDDFRRKVSMR